MLLVTYCSRAADGLTPADFADIAKASAVKNKRLGITGFLVDCDGQFLQALEGPVDQVERLMETIREDPRHCDVQVLMAKQVARRQFGFWGMNWGPLSDPAFRTAALGKEMSQETLLSQLGDAGFVHATLFRSYLHALDLAKVDAAARAMVAENLV